jgi:sialic acid synthase SpsE
MATMDEVAVALSTLESSGARDVTILQCTSLYPAPPDALNLRAMVAMGERFGRRVGLSDHSLGDHAAIAAVALGATVIEKHFTLDRAAPGPDHSASLEPDDFARMVRRLCETALALGDGVKRPNAAERDTAQLVRRSWHTARNVPAGQVLNEDDIVLKRPLGGLPPDQSPAGRRLLTALPTDSFIRAADLAAKNA